MNWCPFFTPDGKYLLYATSEVSHGNYEIFAIDAKGTYEPEYTARLRITHARGFDGLPAFSYDGEHMIWTAQRGKAAEGEKWASERPTATTWRPIRPGNGQNFTGFSISCQDTLIEVELARAPE